VTAGKLALVQRTKRGIVRAIKGEEVVVVRPPRVLSNRARWTTSPSISTRRDLGLNADTVRLGRRGNNKYLIMPLVEDLFRKKLPTFAAGLLQDGEAKRS
jgi:hypothetical protein